MYAVQSSSFQLEFLLQSSGDLQNDENTAAIILNMLRTASRVPLSGDQTQKFKRMSGAVLQGGHAMPYEKLIIF